jgi:Transposase DDE domain
MLEQSLGRFGDVRLERVGAALVASMQHNRTMCLHRLAKDRREARQFGEFLANYRVSVLEMRISAGQHTGRRVAGRHVLAIQDTTELHFTSHATSKRGFGTGGNGLDPGLFLHPILAVDADNGGIIGLVDCAIINRTEGKVTDRHKRAAEDKESYRWLEGAITSGDVLAAAAIITMVADRESDIYDLFARHPATVQLLCRSSSDRLLSDGSLLSNRCAEWGEAERYTIQVPVRGTRPERQANVSLRFGSVSLRRPDGAATDRPEAVTVAVVDVCEIDPPDGAEPVHWRLLTTHSVGTASEARQIVAWYRLRWTIEQVFRSLKSHCLRIEDSQMEQAGCFTKLAMVALIAAVRAMQLVKARDGSTGQPITDAVSQADLPALRDLSRTLEGRTEKLKNPFDPTTLAWFAWVVARLGGWSGYTSKGYKPAGPKTMHHGLLRLDGILTGWNLANRSRHDGLP